MKPPYLTSTMPYPSLDEAGAGLAPGPLTDTVAFHEEGIEDADLQFDHLETTLSHLFREAHPALEGRTYGAALVGGLLERGLLPSEPGPLRILEIGGGTGAMAHGAVSALLERGFEPTWDILELSPELARSQKARCAGLPVHVKHGNALTDPWPARAYDLIVANEMMGDLPSAELTHAQAGLDDETLVDDAHREHLENLGPIGEVINRYTIPLGDAPDPFWLNVGPIALVERVAAHLKPGGAAVLTEFGEMSRWPIVSTHLDHPELSIHFGHLMIVGRALDLEPELAYVMELIDLDREAEGLRTSRSYLRAMGAMLADAGVELRKIGYTRQMFEALIGDLKDDIGDLDYSPIEDRLMGLVPHEFKALLLTKPA
jgi:SAM-dependent methyltransferase